MESIQEEDLLQNQFAINNERTDEGIIEELQKKEHRHKWVIKEVVTSSGQFYSEKEKKWLKFSNEKKAEFLAHYEDLADLTYCKSNGLVIVSKDALLFPKGLFTDEEWEQLQQILNDWRVEEDRKEIYQNYNLTWKKLQRRVRWKTWETRAGLKKWMIHLRGKIDSIEKWQEREKEIIKKKIRDENDSWIIIVSDVLNWEAKEELLVHCSVSDQHGKEVSTIEYGKIYRKIFFTDEEWREIALILSSPVRSTSTPDSIPAREKSKKSPPFFLVPKKVLIIFFLFLLGFFLFSVFAKKLNSFTKKKKKKRKRTSGQKNDLRSKFKTLFQLNLGKKILLVNHIYFQKCQFDYWCSQWNNFCSSFWFRQKIIIES